MKRIIAHILLITYLLSLSGLAFNLYFCGGKLQIIKLATTAVKVQCPCGGKIDVNGCCKNKQVELNTKDNQKSSVNIFSIKIPIVKLLTTLLYFFDPELIKPNLHLKIIFSANTLSYKGSDNLFLLHSTFRI